MHYYFKLKDKGNIRQHIFGRHLEYLTSGSNFDIFNGLKYPKNVIILNPYCLSFFENVRVLYGPAISNILTYL